MADTVKSRRKRLSDLYAFGTPATISDGHNEIDVWVRKLDPLDHDWVQRKARAARALVRIEANDPTSERWLAALDEAETYRDGEERILEGCKLLAAKRIAERNMSIRAELAGGEDSKWAKDGLLDSLLDAWQGDLDDEGLLVAHLDPDHPRHEEAERVWTQLQEFDAEVEAALEAEQADIVDSYRGLDDDERVERIAKAIVDTEAELIGMQMFERALIFKATKCATRVPNPDGEGEIVVEANPPGYYFESFDEVERLHPPVFARLLRAYNEIEVPVMEGKGLPGPEGSSTSSPSPGVEATSTPSGPTVPADPAT